MKLTIESLSDGNAKITLKFKGKNYSETWTKGNHSYYTIGETIIDKLDKNDISAEDTDLNDLIDDVGIIDFMSLAEREEEW